MTFNWSRAPKIPTQLMGHDVNEEMARQATMQDAAQSMAGYKPSVDINSQMAMQGYAPSDNYMKGGNAQPNLEGYGEGLQAASDAAAQAQAVEQQKAELQSQIATLQNRIKENTAKLQKWTGNADQIAAIEARKINSQDPTMVWRWKMGQDAAKQQRADDLKRIEAEKQKTEAKNKQMNQYKIDNILQSTVPTQNMTRDKMDMAVKQLNDAEELAKNYGDIDSLKKINERKNELGIYVPVDDEANIIESDFVKNMEMVGKKGGMNKKQFAQYVQSVLDDPKNKHIWHYSPELQRKLYTAIGKNTGAKPTNYAGY